MKNNDNQLLLVLFLTASAMVGFFLLWGQP